jgi:hypothetical protein
MAPFTKCSESEKRNIADTSDLRQQVLETLLLANSAFTCAVNAMPDTLWDAIICV